MATIGVAMQPDLNNYLPNVGAPVRLTGYLSIAPTTGNFTEGIRINVPDGAYTTIAMGPGEVGSGETTWTIHRTSTHEFTIDRNGSDGGRGIRIGLDGQTYGQFNGPIRYGGAFIRPRLDSESYSGFDYYSSNGGIYLGSLRLHSIDLAGYSRIELVNKAANAACRVFTDADPPTPEQMAAFRSNPISHGPHVDTILSDGLYEIYNDAGADNGLPYGTADSHFYLLVFSHDNNAWVRQWAFDVRSRNVYHRGKFSGIWTAWEMLSSASLSGTWDLAAGVSDLADGILYVQYE